MEFVHAVKLYNNRFFLLMADKSDNTRKLSANEKSMNDTKKNQQQQQLKRQILSTKYTLDGV